jgi:glycolate oxidase iron-sulfur subunit
MDSPRGRIYLMKAAIQQRVGIGEPFVRHFDTCLGCMACETACPSGVRYAPLIEETRATIERQHDRSLGDRLFRRMLFGLLPFPGRLRLLSWLLVVPHAIRRSSLLARLLSILPARIGNLVALSPDRDVQALPERTAAVGSQRLRVGLVTGCVQQVFFGSVNTATARLLAAEGCEVLAPARQGCCGALPLHAGRDEEARAFARAMIETFEETGVERIVVNAAGCGSAMKEYGQLLANDPGWAERARIFAARVRDVTETLADFDDRRGARTPLNMRLAYHDACHLAHAQGIRREPRALLQEIPGVTIVPIAESEICCGSAGIFNLVEPVHAAALGLRKARHLTEAAPDAVATSNPGCILQLRAALRAAGRDIPVYHIVEILDASLGGKELRQRSRGIQ